MAPFIRLIDWCTHTGAEPALPAVPGPVTDGEADKFSDLLALIPDMEKGTAMSVSSLCPFVACMNRY